MAGENIYRLLLPQHIFHHATWIQPIVEYQDGMLRFEHKAAMEYIRQFHFLLNLTIVRELILTFLSLYMGCQPQWNLRVYLLALRFLRRWLRYRQWLHLVVW